MLALLSPEPKSLLASTPGNNFIADAVAELGRPEEIRQVFADFQQYLYQSVA
jgi:hypothetical protein